MCVLVNIEFYPGLPQIFFGSVTEHNLLVFKKKRKMSRRVLKSQRGGSVRYFDSRIVGYLDQLDERYGVSDQEDSYEIGDIVRPEVEEESEQALRDRALRSVRNSSPDPSERSVYNRYPYLKQQRGGHGASDPPTSPQVETVAQPESRDRSRSPACRRSVRLQGQSSNSKIAENQPALAVQVNPLTEDQQPTASITIRQTARSLASQGASKATQRQPFPTIVIPQTVLTLQLFKSPLGRCQIPLNRPF